MTRNQLGFTAIVDFGRARYIGEKIPRYKLIGKEPATNFSFDKNPKSSKQDIGTFGDVLETLHPKLTYHFLRYTDSRKVWANGR